MWRLLSLIALLLTSQSCISRSLMETEQSVVSVYTTIPTTAGTTATLDVYHQIANNIAERITSPIYKFLGISNSTEEKTTKKPWDKIEILDDPEDISKPDLKPVDNDISSNRDIEELSPDISKKANKPEKITLFSSYLPARETLNETNDIDEFADFDLNDDAEIPREGPFIYMLELVGSIIQLLWGGFLAYFKPNSR